MTPRSRDCPVYSSVHAGSTPPSQDDERAAWIGGVDGSRTLCAPEGYGGRDDAPRVRHVLSKPEDAMAVI